MKQGYLSLCPTCQHPKNTAKTYFYQWNDDNQITAYSYCSNNECQTNHSAIWRFEYAIQQGEKLPASVNIHSVFEPSDHNGLVKVFCPLCGDEATKNAGCTNFTSELSIRYFYCSNVSCGCGVRVSCLTKDVIHILPTENKAIIHSLIDLMDHNQKRELESVIDEMEQQESQQPEKPSIEVRRTRYTQISPL